MLALVGPSGCGKTTVLRMIAGLIEPDSGQVLIGGVDLTRAPVHKRKLGLVFQSYALFPHMTVFENVAFGLRRQGIGEPDLSRRVGQALDLVRLGALASRFPRQLSGGQQQRVALARAVVTEPRLLLLDEPLSNLDAALRDEMRVELRRLQQQLGITTVFVTHDQQEALTLADRMAVMRAGRIEQLGAPQLVYERPANAFVAGFVGRSNLFEVAAGPGGLVGPGGIVLAATGIAPQGRLRAALRHEKLRVLGDPPPGANVFPAEIALRSFAGAQALYVVRLDAGVEWQAEAPANPPLPEGTRVAAWFAPEDLLLLPFDG
ncbi:MAG: ABC transporter ATP-binding protein [Acetobacteraceae bacterium]|nr:ABC transporter ATP-binding protein [Acetobacteraceae bacterium]